MSQLTTTRQPVNAADRLRAAQRKVLALAAELHTIDDQVNADQAYQSGGLEDLAELIDLLRNDLAARISSLADKALHDEVEAERDASLAAVVA